MPVGDRVEVDVFAEYERLKVENERMATALRNIENYSKNRSVWVRVFNVLELVQTIDEFAIMARKGLYNI